MGKIAAVLALALLLQANMFDKKCEACHNKMGLPLKEIFFNYLLYHSSESRVKKAMKEYLLHPDIKKSLLPTKKKYLYKHKVNLNELDILLQIYWNKYKVIGKIR